MSPQPSSSSSPPQQQQQQQQLQLQPPNPSVSAWYDDKDVPYLRPTTRNHNNNNSNNSNNNTNNIAWHVQTYTAGEDASRLAAAAKALGLRQHRPPRPPVRSRAPHSTRPTMAWRVVWQTVTDPSVEASRMWSVYSAHDTKAVEYRVILGETNENENENDDDDERERPTWKRFVPEQRQEGQEKAIEKGQPPPQEQDEQPPPEQHDQAVVASPGGTLTAAVLGMIKGMVGPAILYVPHGLASAGYLVALPLLASTTLLFLYSSQCLLEAWKQEQQEDEQEQQYEQQDEHVEARTTLTNESSALLSPSNPPKRRHHHHRVILSYPELAFRAFGPLGESLVKSGIALMQSGVCLTYLIFVPQNLQASMKELFHWDVAPPYWLLLLMVLGLEIPLSWIRDIRKLTPTNLLANVLILYGLSTCLVLAVLQAVRSTGSAHENATTTGSPQDSWTNLVEHVQDMKAFHKDWFLFIGTSVLLFEGSITLLVPLQEAVQTPEARNQFPAVYQRVILCIISFYCFFGLTCWMAFGPQVKTVLTTSLPPGNLATSVQLAYSIAVIFTFPLQNFPALEIACRTIQAVVWANHGGVGAIPSRTSSKPFLTKRSVVSSCLVALLAVVAVCTMDSLDKVVSLMGSLLGCPIAFVFPPLIHSSLVGRANKLSTRRKYLNYLVAGLGVVAMILASAVTLMTWK